MATEKINSMAATTNGKNKMFICHDCGTKKKPESTMGIDPMASQIPVHVLYPRSYKGLLASSAIF